MHMPWAQIIESCVSFFSQILSIKQLFDGTLGSRVPSRSKLFHGTLPSMKQVFYGTGPSMKQLFDGTVLPNSFSLEKRTDLYFLTAFEECVLCDIGTQFT